ncbi:MAG: alpha-L-fucosidase [Eubacteriales bacterium]|nr:alpha-L-fucosidase [Eubacteriales bacterium]
MTDTARQNEKDRIRKAALVLPSQRQIELNCMEFYGFVHFGLYTFDPGREYQTGPEVFHPVHFEPRQWARAFKAAGMKGLLLTCKHHEGFCLWPSRYTDFSVKSSPWKDGKGDVVAEVAQACHEEGLKFGVYLSPWDMHEKTYGTPAYDEYFRNQLTELCTNYGELFCVWFDGACRSKDKVQDYDWDSYYAIIRKLQPNACISICGPDVRWIGNEAGVSRQEEWSVVPKCIMTTERNPGYWRQIDTVPNSTWKDIGSRDFIEKYDDLIWYPAEVDVSIRPSWGYVPGEEKQLHSLDALLDMYMKAVGGNATFLLNVPPNPEGLFDREDVERLAQLGKAIRELFAHSQTEGASAVSNGRDTSAVLNSDRTQYAELDPENPFVEICLRRKSRINLIALKETIERGQQIEKFTVEIPEGESWKEIYSASTIGYQRLCHFPAVSADRIRIRIEKNRGSARLTEIGIYDAEILK